MKNCIWLFALAVLWNCKSVPPPNMLTDKDESTGWEMLFDGKSTNGWHKFNSDGIGKSWQVQDGALMFNPDGKDGGDIVTDKEYEDFELQLEWKISPCGNSGVMYYVVEDDKYDHVWKTGPEMQVLDNSCHPDAKIVKHRAGDLYDLIEGKDPKVNPVGEWNMAKVVSKDGKLEHWLNGKKVVETQLWGDDWKKMVANSKFKSMPDFGTAKRGRISLQDHGDKVWFRNIKIREL